MSVEAPLAVVLGASGGIGRAVSAAFADRGYRVVRHHHHRRPEQADSSVLDVGADLSDWGETSALVDKVLAGPGRPDVVVNCTGVRSGGLLAAQAPDRWRAVFEANVLCTYHPIRGFLPAMMRARTGSFVAFVSVAGPMASPGQTAYAAAKGAIIALVRSLAREYGSRGIVFNAVAPGLVETPMTEDVPAAVREEIVGRQALPGSLAPADLVEAVLFLAASRTVTGQVLFADRGLSL